MPLLIYINPYVLRRIGHISRKDSFQESTTFLNLSQGNVISVVKSFVDDWKLQSYKDSSVVSY